MSKDYYQTLGVNKTASKDEIKKAFHKLAHSHHPDKNGGDDKKFKEVNEAYQTLSDDSKRSQYDRFGADGPQFGGGQQGGGFGGFGGFDPSGFGQGGVEFDMGDLGDIFGDFFGGGGGRRNAKPKGRDLETEVNITFKESIFGVVKKINLNKQSTCDVCLGTGAKTGTELKTCKDCDGKGQTTEIKRSILGSFKQVTNCKTCLGSGKIPEHKCSTCNGHGVFKKQSDVEIKIPEGINNGEMLRVYGYGESVKGGATGDLYVRVKVESHHLFKRDEANLIMNLSIKLTDALLGMNYNLETLDGNKIEVKIPSGINHGELLRVKGRGVPTNRGRGDIIIKIQVKMPNKLSKNEKELVEKLKEEGI